MDWKRIFSALLGLPLVLVILVIGNKYVVDIALSIVALISIHEFFDAISEKAKPIRWLGYVSCISVALIHIIPSEYFNLYAILSIPIILLILFLHIIISQMRINLKDIAYTFLGIAYIVLFVMCLAAIRGMEHGKILIWYAIIAAWATDIFAYFVGKYLGKHKFSSISPNKTIEGCVGGVIGAIVVALIYTFFVNQYLNVSYSYTYVVVFSIILSLVGQVGDFAASSIKRYVNIKDYSELIPGHGGMLDRIDSLLFIAPFAYVMLMFL